MLRSPCAGMGSNQLFTLNIQRASKPLPMVVTDQKGKVRTPGL